MISPPRRPERNLKLDVLRVLAILECIVSHAYAADHPDRFDCLWLGMFLPDTAAIFIMASGALILARRRDVPWRYVGHRVMSFLPEFVIFSVLYVLLDNYYGFTFEGISTLQRLCYMFVTPTWGPGWFILALTGVYVVLPLLSAWTAIASKRSVEIGLAIWLCSTIVPIIRPHTLIDIPASIFGTVYNYAGYALLGYYLVKWPLARRSTVFKACYFVLTVGIGVIFGYYLGRSGARWGYMGGLISGLSLNIVMVSLLQFGIVMLMPERWFGGVFGRYVTWLSILSLGIYCCHWLVIRYWAMEEGINWIVGTLVALAVSIPVAMLMRYLRGVITRR